MAARPRSLGVRPSSRGLGVAQGLFLSTEVGQELVLDQQIRAMEAFGMNISDQMYDQMEQGMKRVGDHRPNLPAIFWPIAIAIEAGILLVDVHAAGGRRRDLQAGLRDRRRTRSVIIALQQVFSWRSATPAGTAGANLGVFVPMLEETSFVTLFSVIDLFFVWSTFSLAIGLGVLYKRRTGQSRRALLGIYVVIALVIAFFRSGS